MEDRGDESNVADRKFGDGDDDSMDREKIIDSKEQEVMMEQGGPC